MANITIHEISQNYTYNVGTSTFATVAVPITSCWGPAFQDPDSLGLSLEDALERTTWNHFPSNQEGLELDFVLAQMHKENSTQLVARHSQ